jgi:hypothetical protein
MQRLDRTSGEEKVIDVKPTLSGTLVLDPNTASVTLSMRDLAGNTSVESTIVKTSHANEPPPKLSTRETRMLRWIIHFDTSNGEEYLRQLRALGGILAIPRDAMGVQYYLIRDLSAKPPKLLEEDVSKIDRIFWIDDKPNSVKPLMEAIGLSQRPDRVVVFLPPQFEEKLFELEKKYQNLKEDEIYETVFQVTRKDGEYVPLVVQQKQK